MWSGPKLPSPPVRTLVHALTELGDRPWLTVHGGAAARSFTGPELDELARRYGGALRAAGVAPGDRVLVLLPNDVRFIGAFFGAMSIGAVAVPLAWPFSLGNVRKALEALAPLVRAADARALVTVEEMAGQAEWPVPVVLSPGEPVEPVEVAPDDAAFVQFTSGSIGQPRGAVITHRAAIASAFAMGLGLGMGHSDVGVSWLPLFHDMGLVGAVFCPLVHRFPLHLMSPTEFLLHPSRWLQRISEVGGTLSVAPDFAYALVARRVKAEGLDLSSWRHALCGSEPVHRATIDAFVNRFAAAGFRAEAFKPVYGLAENTLGVCFADPDRPGADLRWQGRDVPSVGFPLPGMEIGLRAGERWLAEGEEGEIVVRGPSLSSGYFRDEEATSRTLRDGWLHTGDLGVVEGGQLYITGREKDLVIQKGRKFHPYDIERVAARAVDAPPNGAAAFSVVRGDAEELVVVVEHRAAAGADVEGKIRGGLLEELGVRVERVVSVAPGQIPRTTSGKVRRRECAERFGSP